MLNRRPLIVALSGLLLILGSCRNDKAVPAVDSAAASTAAAPAPVVVGPSTGWNESEAGSVLLLSVSEAVRRASVVIPGVTDIRDADATSPDSVRGTEFDLFDRSGNVGVATLEAIAAAPAEACAGWPTATFRDTPARNWRVGFSYRAARAITLDSLSSTSSADSTLMTTELARLASSITANGDPVFQGLPFTVREAYRLHLPTATVIIGDIVRTINEEANPREEHLLLVAEKQSADTEFRTAFYSRAAGSEDEVRTNEILAAVRFTSTNREAIVVQFGFEEGDRVALLERVATGNWKITWRSAYSGC
jgi:hypothetical protein